MLHYNKNVRKPYRWKNQSRTSAGYVSEKQTNHKTEWGEKYDPYIILLPAGVTFYTGAASVNLPMKYLSLEVVDKTHAWQLALLPQPSNDGLSIFDAGQIRLHKTNSAVKTQK